MAQDREEEFAKGFFIKGSAVGLIHKCFIYDTWASESLCLSIQTDYRLPALCITCSYKALHKTSEMLSNGSVVLVGKQTNLLAIIGTNQTLSCFLEEY